MSSAPEDKTDPPISSQEKSSGGNESLTNNGNNNNNPQKDLTPPEPPPEPPTINQISIEMLTHVFNHLPVLELLISVSLVCKKWRQYVLDLCKKKPLTLVFCKNIHRINYYKNDLINSLFAFFDVPIKCGHTTAHTLYLSFDKFVNQPQPLAYFKNITELVLCGGNSQFCRIVNVDHFRNFITKHRTKLTHLKLIVLADGPDSREPFTFADYNFSTTIWQVVEQVGLPSLRHVSISSINPNCMQGADNLVPKLNEFYFTWNGKVDFMPTLRLLNKQASIGINWTDLDKIKTNLTELKKELPSIWLRITRISDGPISRRTFKPENAIVNFIKPESLLYLHLNLNVIEDYQAYYKEVSQMTQLEHLWIRVKDPFMPNKVFQFVREGHAMRARFPAHKSPSTKSVHIFTVDRAYSNTTNDYLGENLLEPVQLLFPNIDSMSYVIEGMKEECVSLIVAGEWRAMPRLSKKASTKSVNRTPWFLPPSNY